MTDTELIDLVYEKSPDEFSTEELGLLRVRMHDSNEIRLALWHRVQLEQGLVETLQAPPLPVAQMLSSLTSGGAGSAAVQTLVPSSNGRGHLVEPAAKTGRGASPSNETIRSTTAAIAPPSAFLTWAIRACVSAIVVSAVVLTSVVVERAFSSRPDDRPPAGVQPAPVPPTDQTDPTNGESMGPITPPEDEDDERSPSDTVPPGFR